MKQQRIVVFIDDLDRCLLDKALDMLEYIKLVLAQPGFIFVLGLDRRLIEAFLNKRFQKDYGVDEFVGREYLDKLVQLSFRIPPHTSRLQDFSLSLVNRIKDQLSQSELEELKQIAPVFGVACNHNPRAVVRYINNLLVDRSIAHTLNRKDLTLSVFAVSRALQERWPRVFDFLQKYDHGDAIASLLKADPQVESGTNKAEIFIREHSRDVDDVISQVYSQENLRALLKSKAGLQYLKDLGLRRSCAEFLRFARLGNIEDWLSARKVCRVAIQPRGDEWMISTWEPDKGVVSVFHAKSHEDAESFAHKAAEQYQGGETMEFDESGTVRNRRSFGRSSISVVVYPFEDPYPKDEDSTPKKDSVADPDTSN